MIIITTYHEKEGDNRFLNRKKYLDETIKSIDRQKYENIFHILVDDGSSKEIYNYLFKKYNKQGKRVVLRREKKDDEPLTSTNARNFAINFCLENKLLNIKENDFISFIDSDDVLINLSQRIKFLKIKNPDFMYTDSLLFFEDTDICYRWQGLEFSKTYNNFWVRGKMPYPTMTWKVDFMRKLKKYIKKEYGVNGPFDPDIGCGEDVDLALSSLECAEKNDSKIYYLPEITAGYRIHKHSLATIRNQSKRSKEERSVINRHFGYSANILYLKRFLIRPECSIPCLMSIKRLFREKLSKKDYL